MDSTPTWLTQAFLEKSFQRCLNDSSIKIDRYSIEPATGKGENFASCMYRIKLVINQENKIPRAVNCIVKIPCQDGFGLELLTKMNVYDKELEMYAKVLPALTQLLNDHSIEADIVPSTIYVSNSRKAIVFEDLAVKGFVMANRKNGINMQHAKILLEKLAKYHGGNAVLAERQPDIFQNFKHGMFSRATDSFASFCDTAIDALADLVSTWPEFEDITVKLRRLRPHVYENGRKAFDAKKNQFNTLTHGDMWVNNAMFSYNDRNEPEKVMLVDFQFCFWGSPTIDLQYFLNSSLEEDIRLNGQDELINYYHSVLRETLIRLGHSGRIPTLLEFHMEVMENSYYAFISSCLVQPLFLNEDSDMDVDIESLHGNNEKSFQFIKHIFKTEQVQRNIRKLLPIYYYRGLLD